MIEVENLSRRFGAREAVRDVSFTIAPGEIVGFLGPNGAGKTTTLRMLTGYLPPSAGRARVAGFDVETQSLDVRSRIGYLPESVPLYRDLTVAAYLDFVGSLKGLARATRRERADVVTQACGIADVAGRRIGTLSRGYRQRVGIAQALLGDPDVLFLDEPTVGLDPRQIVEIRDLIRSLAGRRTVLLSTHILPEVNLLCQRVLIIHRGRLVSDGPPDRLSAQSGNAVRVVLEARASRASLESVLGGVSGIVSFDLSDAGDGVSRARILAADNADPREAIAEALVRNGIGVRALALASATLEDVFLQIVTREEQA